MQVLDSARLAATALMVGTCGGLAVLAKRARGAKRWAALVVAVGLAAGWVSLALGDDDLAPVQPATGVGAWIEACAPAVGIAAAWLVTRRPRR